MKWMINFFNRGDTIDGIRIALYEEDSSETVATMNWRPGQRKVAEIRACHIVKAVNAHESLVASLKEFIDSMPGGVISSDATLRAVAALVLADEKTTIMSNRQFIKFILERDKKR